MTLKQRLLPYLQKTFILLVALLGLVLIALGVFGNNSIITFTQLNRHCSEMEKRVSDLERENQKLLREINALRYDPLMIERIAREELGMVKPGEILYQRRRGEKK